MLPVFRYKHRPCRVYSILQVKKAEPQRARGNAMRVLDGAADGICHQTIRDIHGEKISGKRRARTEFKPAVLTKDVPHTVIINKNQRAAVAAKTAALKPTW